jgi:formate hydrogenlyase subunit 4
MTDPLDNAPEADDRPLPPVTRQPVAACGRPPRRFATFVKWWLVTSFLLVVACVACLAIGMNQLDFSPLHIVIDGNEVGNGLTIEGLGAGARVLLAVGAVMLALLLLLLVPMVMLLVIGCVAIALVAGLGLPLAALALAFMVVSSPLWLIGLFVWLLVRRRPSPRHAPSATMAA